MALEIRTADERIELQNGQTVEITHVDQMAGKAYMETVEAADVHEYIMPLDLLPDVVTDE